MERRKFISTCCYSTAAMPLASVLLQSCERIYYATSSNDGKSLVVARSEFIRDKNGRQKERKFVLLERPNSSFPICLYKMGEHDYVASLLECTHRGCELNVGGGIYTCPCHGSEFSLEGKVLEGPAEEDLTTYRTEHDNENIYVFIQ